VFALHHFGKVPENVILEMRSFGTGRAPGRFCGALYAAIQHAPNPVLASAMQEQFAEASGGHVTCPQIRLARKLSCVQCVELASDLLSKALDT